MAYTIKFTISAAPAITNYWIAVLYKTTAPTSEVARIDTIGNVHSAPVNLIFPDLEGGVYIVKIHDSVDNIALGNIRHDFEIDARTNRILSEKRFYVVGGSGDHDPVDGDTSMTDPYFDGKTIGSVFQTGYRPLMGPNEYPVNPSGEWRQDPGGVLTFLNDFISGGQITMVAQDVVTVEITFNATNDTPTSGGLFNDITVVFGDVTLTSFEYNKIVVVSPSAATQVTLLPGIGSVPAKTGYMIVHDGGNAVNIKVVCGGAEHFQFNGESYNSIILAKGEFIKFVRYTNIWYVIDSRGQWDRIGEVVASDILLPNSLIMDGAFYDGNIYTRLYDYVMNKVPIDQKTDPTSWATNRTMYGIDTSSQTVIVPDRRDYMVKFLKVVGSSDLTRPQNVPGGVQTAQVGEINFRLLKGDGYSGHTATAGRFAPGQNGNPQGDTDVNNIIKVNAGLENRVKNVGALPLLLI